MRDFKITLVGKIALGYFDETSVVFKNNKHF